MPTDRYFERYPPFPSDVSVVNLNCLSFTKLLANDALESRKLFQACQETGFFLINLKGSDEGETMLTHAETAFDLNERIHQVEKVELQKYAFKPPADLLGTDSFVRLGTNPSATMKLEDGSPDRMAFYSLGQDDILGNIAPRANPPMVESHRAKFKSFFTHAHLILSRLLSHLDTHLDLSPGTLASFCPLEKASGTSLRLLKALPSSAGIKARTDLVGHTDMGAITMLFNVVGGLQILPPSASDPPNESDWHYIRPVSNCALINLGDALVQWSGGVVQSSMHRVATAPGAQRGVERFSVAYLVRPALDSPMRQLREGNVIPRGRSVEEQQQQEEDITARDWERMRAAQIIKGQNKPGSIGERVVGKKVEKEKTVAN